MATYMIHACEDRIWYVEKYLIPSMLEQGIKEEQILKWYDLEHRGNLYAFADSMKVCGERAEEGIWHLQDDVIISKRFKELTEEHDYEIVAGICMREVSDTILYGRVDKQHIWYSFQCIRIPNRVAQGFAEWFFSFGCKTTQYKKYVDENKYDDLMFWIYLQDFCKWEKTVFNHNPNLVDHIDWLIGGSIVNTDRTRPLRAHFFDDDMELIEKLKQNLKK